MSRVMTVRNDEELKNLRKIGIFGVRYRENCSRLEINGYWEFTVAEPLALGRNPMSADCSFGLTPRINNLS